MARSVTSEAERARLFAKAYVNLVEALLQQGVNEKTARAEARMAAMVHIVMLDEDAQEHGTVTGFCPVCGRG